MAPSRVAGKGPEVHLPQASLEASACPDDGGLRVRFRYPDANLGDWNGCVALYSLAVGTVIRTGSLMPQHLRRAFRKVVRNKPSGAVTFSARTLVRLRDGLYTFVLLMDSVHELGWRCLAHTPPFRICGGAVDLRVTPSAADFAPPACPDEAHAQAPAEEEALVHELDDLVGSSELLRHILL